MTGAEVAYVGLGANLGRSEETLAAAFLALSRLPRTRLVARSSMYLSAPVQADGPDYVNAVAALDTELTPRELLAQLQEIEAVHGRERTYVNAPRTLDLDLLLHGERHIDQPGLVVPHPRMHLRAFVLVPLAEIAPGLSVPGLGPIDTLLPPVGQQRVHRLAAS